MNKLLSFTGGLPNFSIDEVLFNDDAIRSALQEIFRAFGDNYIIQGVTGTTSITAGYIMLDGELLQVDAHTKTNTHFAKVTTYDSLGDITFNDGVVRQTWQKNRATISSGSGSLEYSTALRLNDVISQLNQNLTTKKKILQIGTWNMDSTASVTIAHGLTIDDILSVTVTIIGDTLPGRYPIEFQNAGYTSVGASDVGITRNGGGFFDSPNFDSTSINRGWIIIEYLS